MQKSINELLRFGEKELEVITDTNMLDAKLLLSYVLNKDSLYLFMNRDEEVSHEQIDLYEKLIRRRKSGEPLQYIIEHQEFMGLDFYVSPGVLIPRGDTEVMVEILIEKLKNLDSIRILDIGAGSGAIHVALAYYLKQSTIVAVDISSDAIEIAQKNAKVNKVNERITYCLSDLFDALDENDKFDVIVSNPPYIPTEVIDGLQKEVSVHEPRLALDGGKDGYDFYKRIINDANNYFKDNGLLAFEVGHDQAQTIRELLEMANYKDIEIYKDLNSIERVVIARYER